MGDALDPSQVASDPATHEAMSGAHAGNAPSAGPAPTVAQATNPAHTLDYRALYQPQYNPSQPAYAGQYDMAQVQQSDRPGPYNMAAIANALPQTGYRPGYNTNQQHQKFSHDNSPAMMSQMPQFAGQYYMPQQMQQMAPYFAAQMAPQQPPPPHHNHIHAANMSQRHSGYYPSTMPMMGHPQGPMAPGYYYPQPQHYTTSSSVQPPMNPSQYLGRGTSSSNRRGSTASHVHDNLDSAENSRGMKSTVVRGPPRKPRQSGHAIWIGNLPPQTDLMRLVHHVCNEAAGLESLFLISKSNCAFANFKDEQTCAAAQQKLHDSKFQTVRLVSRLRKSTVEGATGQTAPTGPAATSPGSAPTPAAPGDDESVPPPQPPPVDADLNDEQPPAPASVASPAGESAPLAAPIPDAINGRRPQPTDTIGQKDKFFILKSLTVEDLDLSVRNGVWATQSHNEETLNKAFSSADNVYLVFSANKSGEYFGYARMVSPINEDPAAAIEFAPKAQVTSDLDLPKAVPTEATDKCPKGRIIDDSARGTIFWEVERDEPDQVPTEGESEDSGSTQSGQDGEEGSAKAWGKPFKLEWLSSNRLPFYRTRGLRNPWNSNREVKIARDGTELEPSTGRKLIGLFNRVQSPGPLTGHIRQGVAPTIAGYPPPMYPQ